jgi:hypothetical protein
MRALQVVKNVSKTTFWMSVSAGIIGIFLIQSITRSNRGSFNND